MNDVWLRAFSLLFFLVLGLILKKAGVVHQSDFGVLSRIVLRVTLPCAVVVNLNGADIDLSMLGITLMGLMIGVLLMGCGYLLYIRKSRALRAFGLLNLAGFNIGNFALPFIQGMLGATGALVTSIFDVGNSIVCLGGAYSIASLVKYRGEGQSAAASFRRVGKAMITSVPFDFYIGMAILGLLHISLPDPVVAVAQVGANANPFLSMFMLGVAFRLGSVQERFGEMLRILVVRYGVCIAIALAIYFLLPYPEAVRQPLCLLCLASIGSAIPPFTHELGEDYTFSGTINSISVLISIALILGTITVFFA